MVRIKFITLAHHTATQLHTHTRTYTFTPEPTRTQIHEHSDKNTSPVGIPANFCQSSHLAPDIFTFGTRHLQWSLLSIFHTCSQTVHR